MPDDSEYEVMAVTGAFIAEDTSAVQVQLSVVSRAPLLLNMTPHVLGAVTRRLTELHSGVQIQIGSTTGHIETHASDVRQVTAQAPAGGGKVILSLRTSSGMVHEFGLSPDQAKELRVEMRKAEASAREQASQSRN